MRVFYLAFLIIFFTGCVNNKKAEKKERLHTSLCDCYITDFETKHNRSQKDQDFLNSCHSYLNTFTEEELDVIVKEFWNSGCFDDYLWSFGDEGADNLGSFESDLKIKPKTIKK